MTETKVINVAGRAFDAPALSHIIAAGLAAQEIEFDNLGDNESVVLMGESPTVNLAQLAEFMIAAGLAFEKASAAEHVAATGSFCLVEMPPALRPSTIDLVAQFAAAMARKLRGAEEKHGYSDHWKAADLAALADDLRWHVAKGDPLDVAGYCAFFWYRSASVAEAAPAGMMTPADVAHLRDAGEMLARWFELIPDANGQHSFNDGLLHAVELDLVAAFWPLRELCPHAAVDAQAMVCRVCGANAEDTWPFAWAAVMKAVRDDPFYPGMAEALAAYFESVVKRVEAGGYPAGTILDFSPDNLLRGFGFTSANTTARPDFRATFQGPPAECHGRIADTAALWNAGGNVFSEATFNERLGVTTLLGWRERPADYGVSGTFKATMTSSERPPVDRVITNPGDGKAGDDGEPWLQGIGERVILPKWPAELLNFRCPDCGDVLSAGGHRHVCRASAAASPAAGLVCATCGETDQTKKCVYGNVGEPRNCQWGGPAPDAAGVIGDGEEGLQATLCRETCETPGECMLNGCRKIKAAEAAYNAKG